MTERKKILYFLTLTFILSYLVEMFIVFNGGVNSFGIFMLTGLMWLPGLSSLSVRLAANDWDDIGLKLGSINNHFLGFIISFALSFLVFYLCSLFGIRKMALVSDVPLQKIIAQLGIVFAIGYFSALGEELGWRGFLTPKIYSMGIKHPTLISGVIWASWHMPLVALGGYYASISPIIVVTLYSLMILTLNVFMNWIRLFSGSVFVATSAHAFYNFFFQTFWFHLLFKAPGPNGDYWLHFGGDMGIFTTIAFFMILLFGKYVIKQNISVTMPVKVEGS